MGNTIIDRLLLFIEEYIGKRFIAGSKGIIAMTEEIAQYELKRAGKYLPYIVVPNGIDVRETLIVEDKRGNEINIAFIASNFYPWHGLDLIVEEIEKNKLIFILHLIGNVPADITKKIKASGYLNSTIRIHGHLNRTTIVNILSKCDIGINALAINREGMSEACTLKVREYLASGLPVYSRFKDSGLPQDFPFYKIGAIDIKQILKYAMNMKRISREEVRNKAIPYIDKTSLIKNLFEFISRQIK